MKRVVTSAVPASFDRNLLLMMGEEVKQSLIAIAQLAEINTGSDTGEIQVFARKALKTIDNIELFQRLNSGQTSLVFEPVHVGSTMQDVAVNMQPLMRVAGCKTELHIQHGLSPVDVDKNVLSGALYGLWQAFLGVVKEGSDIYCSAKRTSSGVRLTLRSSTASLEGLSLHKVNEQSVQPIVSIAGSATDLLTSKNLFAILGGTITKISGSHGVGLGVTLPLSRQLQMI